MVLTFDPQDLSGRFTKARIDARSRSAKRWLDPTHIQVVRAELKRLPTPTLKPLSELIATADALAIDDSSADEGTTTLETAIWPAIDALLEPLRADNTGWRHLDQLTAAGLRDKIAELAEIIRLYELIVPRAAWPSVIVAASEPGNRETLVSHLTDLRLVRGDDGRRHKALGLVRVLIPPEPEFIRILAALPSVAVMADPAAIAGKIARKPSPSDDGTDLHATLAVPSWAPGELGRDVAVALLDSGVDRTHHDLKDLPADRCKDFTDDGGMTDHFGHGTLAAGIIAGSGESSNGIFRGIAPRCKLYVAKVADAGGAAALGAVIDALDWAVSEANADLLVVPIDLPGEPGAESLIGQAMSVLSREGRLVVCAAGDGGPGLDTLIGAAWPREVLAVGAADGVGDLAAFSARGRHQGFEGGGDSVPAKPDCTAPGVDVVGPRSSRAPNLRAFDDNGEYTISSGTSLAAPAIAGALALVLSAARETHGQSVRAVQIRHALLQSGRPVINASPRFEAGHGTPETRAAIGDVQSKSLPTLEAVLAGRFETADREASKTSSGASQTIVSPNWRQTVEQSLPTDPSAHAMADETADDAPVSTARQLLDELDARRVDDELDVISEQAAERARERLSLAKATEPGMGLGSRPGSAAMNGPFGAGSSTERVVPFGGPFGESAGESSGQSKAAGKPPAKAANATHEDDTLRARDEPISQTDFDAQQDGTIDIDLARKLEQEFINGFEARFYTLSSVPNPLESNKRYEIQTAGETTAFFSDRDELKKLLIRGAAKSGDLRTYPLNKGVEIALVRKRLFGNREKKLAFIGACISPLEELVETGRASKPANRRDLVRLVDRCVTDETCFYYLGFFSTTGWTEDAKEAAPRGKNYQVFLLECEEDIGFRVYAPSDLDPVVRQAFDPEDEITKLDRARRRLRKEKQLQIPGGFLLIKEVAENANVPEPIAMKAAEELAREEASIRIEKVDNTIIVRHKRF